jgi:hypothetical protein
MEVSITYLNRSHPSSLLVHVAGMELIVSASLMIQSMYVDLDVVSQIDAVLCHS